MARHRETKAAASLATSVVDDATGYGRIVRDSAGRFERIVEQKNCTPEQLKIREVNLDGVVRVARDGFALLKASGRGSLVNVASIMGHRGLRQLTAYSATKGAVIALTRGLAVEYAPFNIRVNALAPGFVETALTARVLRNPGIKQALVDNTPMRRFGLAEEIAKAALFLASDDASFVTGADLAVDGGMSAGL